MVCGADSVDSGSGLDVDEDLAQEEWHNTNFPYLVIQAMIVDFSFSYRMTVSQGSIGLPPQPFGALHGDSFQIHM